MVRFAMRGARRPTVCFRPSCSHFAWPDRRKLGVGFWRENCRSPRRDGTTKKSPMRLLASGRRRPESVVQISYHGSPLLAEAADIVMRRIAFGGGSTGKARTFFPMYHLAHAAAKEFGLYSWAMTDSTTLSQRFFELDDIRAIQGRSWIPLRQDGELERESPFTGIGCIREYSGVASLAVQATDRGAVDPLDWGEVDVATHRPSLDQGVYRPADVHCEWTAERKTIGTRLVIAQEMSGLSPATRITQEIIARLEAGTKPWIKPWRGVPVSRPLRACGIPYRGMNVFWLWMVADMCGYASPFWMTYNQAKSLGAQVRKGEKSTIAIFYKSYTKEVEAPDTGEKTDEARRVLKA